MVPNISGNGRSFRGAGAYHLHDKPSEGEPRPRTSDRVAFTATRNLANEEPLPALDEMWRTAEDARHLKAWAGLAPSGRKSVAPVKTVSLAWAPGERPTREEMSRAADSFMKAMGWAEHQIIYVGHNDTRHCHLHLIINRVHPDNGRTLDDWQERKRAQNWAHAYEQQQGIIRCPARAAKQDRIAHGSAPGLPYREAKLLKDRDTVARKRIARHLRAAFRPAWAAHYRRQRAALESLDRRRGGVERLAATLVRQGDSLGAMRALEVFADHRAELVRSFRKQRATLARSQNAALRTLLAADPPQSAAPPLHSRYARHATTGDSALRTRAVSPEVSLTHARPSQPSPRLAPAYHGSPRLTVRPSQSDRHRRLALSSAARELLPPPRAASRHAAARARAEIAVQFAHRWAAIRRMPPEERAAAAAALNAEQSAALAARTKHLLGELQQEQRSEQARRRTFLAARRVARLSRRREAWAAAASTVAARRLAHAPARPVSATSPPMRTVAPNA
jgi:hypothetical protein